MPLSLDMNRHYVLSRQIKSIGYDKTTSTLEVEFHLEKIFQFKEVPEEIFIKFITAVSKGNFFEEFICDKYESIEITEFF